MILQRYGGLYADMDYYCCKPFDEVFSKFTDDFYVVCTPNSFGDNTYFSNSLMYSKPNHSFWRKLLIQMEIDKSCPIYYSRHMIIMYTTGPGILTRVYNLYTDVDKLSSFPMKLFHPYGIGDNKLSLHDSKDKVYAIHLGKGSWESSDSRFFLLVYTEWKILLFILLLVLPIISNFAT
jgi:mannosyltransferase OCH1-like enzyme